MSVAIVYASICIGVYVSSAYYFLYLTLRDEPQEKTNCKFRRNSI